jgi:hypothetical protein
MSSRGFRKETLGHNSRPVISNEHSEGEIFYEG